MLDFPRWKIWSIILVLVLGVFLAIPSLFPSNLDQKFGLGALPRINFGLDLSGGSHILLEADTADVAHQRIVTMEEMVRSQISRAQPAITIGDMSADNDQLSFMVRDNHQLDSAVEAVRTLTNGIGATGQRDWDVRVVDSNRIVMRPTKAGIQSFVNQAMEGATEVVRKRIDSLGTREPIIIRQGSDRIVVQVPGLQNPSALKALIGKTAKLEFKLVDDSVKSADLAQGKVPIGTQVMIAQSGQPVAVQRRAIVTGVDLVHADQTMDQNSLPAVSISFNADGGRRFAEVTQKNPGKRFAIILDNVILSAPSINEPILGGSAIITGSFTIDSANQMAIALRSGSLPVALKVVEERTVGPGLGADSIRAGTLACSIAIVAIVIFMISVYGRFGIYASSAVILNLFLILAVMAVLGATLTLPGIAGLVLTIGAAVDANVLINERIREEIGRGRTPVHAVDMGYKEASRTIFDANVTHAISALIMICFGSGPVKGFAVVLLIGIITSVFTAVTFTRMLVALYLRRRPAKLTI